MGIMHRTSHFTILNVLFILCSLTWPCFCRNATLFCREEERLALLEFKRSLHSGSSDLLQSWEMKDCCTWKGVACDPKSGHVTKLELPPSRFSGRLADQILEMPLELPPSPFSQRLMDQSSKKSFSAYELSPSISKLRYLTYLDLSGFKLINSTLVPQFIGSMKQLRYLNLSGVGFHGIIPYYFGNLTYLEVLDLQDSEFPFRDHVPMVLRDPHWISSLMALKYLDMGGLQLGKAYDLMKVLGELPSLMHLALSRSGINNSHLSRAGGVQNSSSFANLQYLDLSGNAFQGQVPGSLFQNMSSLNHVDLSGNSFDSFERPFSLNPNLETMYASGNNFKGKLPDWLWNLTNTRYLSLSSNGFQGVISESLGYLRSLQMLELAGNNLCGPIPRSLENLSELQWLDLRANRLNGPIPQSLGQLSRLRQIALSDNLLEGTISEAHFSNLLWLKELYLSDNNLTIRIRADWVPPFQLSRIIMQSCKFEAKFPKWIQTQRSVEVIVLSNSSILGDMPGWLGTKMKLEYLDLSRNKITGVIPNFSSSLVHLDLSRNQITGSIPMLSSHLVNLFLSHNQITGPIPTFPSRLASVDLSHNQIIGPIPTLSSRLGVLDLSYNQIIGPIPTLPRNLFYLILSHNMISGPIQPAMGVEGPWLSFLFLNDNFLSGPIPAWLCSMETLEEMDMSNNKLSGPIPDCWGNSTFMHIINWSSNNFSGHVPSSIGKLRNLISLHLNNNSFQGELPITLKSLTNLEVLDLGENNLSGDLSTLIGDNFQSLHIMRLRHNRLSGKIPQQLCLLPQLRILDLATNNLVGTIPPCFRNITGMTAHGNFSTLDNWSEERLLEALGGRELEYTRNLIYFIALDLSSNNLVGTIPEDLTHLTGLIGLNLSHNLLTGNIPSEIGSMKWLVSLDVSSNVLSGTIPQGISALTFLSHLNLSNNNFSGRIPKGSQLDTLYRSDRSIYAGNPLLCGDPLQTRCPGDKEAEAPRTSTRDEDGSRSNSSDKMILYGFIALGFAMGFWGVIGALALRKDWRASYFSFVEEAKDRICVVVALKVAKIQRRMNG